MEIPSKPELPPKSTPEIFISYAWGDDSSEDARQRTEIVDRLCETLGRSGDLISGFMKRIGLADHVIVVLSDKYLRSPYCMTELHSIYQRSVGEKEDFLRRIIPPGGASRQPTTGVTAKLQHFQSLLDSASPEKGFGFPEKGLFRTLTSGKTPTVCQKTILSLILG